LLLPIGLQATGRLIMDLRKYNEGYVPADRRHEARVRQGPQADMFLMHHHFTSA
jgi:hypothetical protein